MAKVNKHIDELHDKFFHGKATKEEIQELYEFFKDSVCADGKIHEGILNEFLITSHPDYGKPDKDGKILEI